MVLLSVKNSGENLRLASKDDTKKKVEKTSKGMQLGFYPGKIRNSILMCIHTLSLVCIGLYSYCSAIAYISDTMSLRREVLPPVARA